MGSIAAVSASFRGQRTTRGDAHFLIKVIFLVFHCNRILILSHLVKDLLVCGELTALLLIGVNHAVVHGHFKNGIVPTH